MIYGLNIDGKTFTGTSAVEIGLEQLKYMLETGNYKNRDNIVADIKAYEFIIKYGLEKAYFHVRDRYKNKTARFILEVMKRETEENS